MYKSKISLNSIGVIHSEHTNPEETPIQSLYARGCKGKVIVDRKYENGLQDVEGFSHVYLLYHFHRAENPVLLVKPFLHDIERGVFATRSPRRPNPIGISIVRVISREDNVLYVDGMDILDNTPLLDIKPYVPRFDHILTEKNGWQDQVDEKAAHERGVRSYRPDPAIETDNAFTTSKWHESHFAPGRRQS